MTLKSILYDMIHKHPEKSLEQIAEEIGVSTSYLTRSALPDKDDVDNPDQATGCRFPLKKLIPLIRTTRDFRLLDHIEQSLGRVAFELPKARPGYEKIHQQLAKSIQEFGEFIKTTGKSIEDGTITDIERAACEKEAYELIQALMALLKLLEAK